MECEKHKKAVRGEMRGETSSAKVTSFFTASRSKSDETVLVAGGAFVFHTMKHHSSYMAVDCTYVLFKQYFLILKQPANSRACRQAEATINSVIAARATENIMQVFKSDSVLLWNCHRCKQSQCCENVPVVIQYFDWKNGGLQSEVIDVLQQSNGAAETVAQKIKGTPENDFFFNLQNIWAFDQLLFLIAFAYFNGTENVNNFYIF